MKRIIAAICLLALILSVGAFSACALSPTQYAPDNPWFDYELGKDPDYSFAVIGDIQTLAWFDQREGTTYTKKLVDWILNNKDDRKIEYVFGLGDTIETLSSWDESGYNTSVTNPGEWSLTSAQIKRMNAVIPYMIVRGNHDDEAGYHKYICTDDYKSQMDGFFYDASKPALRGNSMSNSYKKITAGGQKYLMLALDFDVNDEVIDWANNVIEANPDYRVIAAVHAYNSSSGGFLKGDIGQPGTDNETDGDTNHDWFYFDGEKLWNEIFSQHENMFMVLSGHVSVTNPVVKERKGAGDNYVFEVLVDPQAHDEGLHESGEAAGAFVMLINFSINGNRLEFEYISTTRDMHYKNSNQYVKKVHGTSLLELKTTTTKKSKEEDDDEDRKKSGGCSASLTYSAVAVSALGTSLSTFALRKKKKR